MTNSNKYTELLIKINPEIEDIVSGICFENFPCEGVILAEETYKDLEMIATTEGTLKVFLTEPIPFSKADKILKEQKELLKSRGFSEEELGSWEITVTEKENEDWSKKWKEKWDVTHVSERITVVPDWIDYTPKKDDEVIIKLEPGCAFGTGTHQTTQLCMKAIEKYMPTNANMADIGMGSGILAICASKFGANKVYGCDNDPTVIDVAKENALKNNANCFFELNTADNLTEKYDFICANILHNVLAMIMGDLKNIMQNGSYMVLSGILDEKKPVVVEAIKTHELELIEEMHQDQWVALVVKRG
ncbi:50S ribosomal protein L11 methyltransferase [bacterium]|nr:50S ribosomal protein L11 methyltransferase [bacterium]